MNEYVTIAVNRSSHHFIQCFHSFHGLMSSMNWPASSIWVFIAQLGEHCSANAEATGSNPVEAPKNLFSGYFRNCLNNIAIHCDGHILIHLYSRSSHRFIQSNFTVKTIMVGGKKLGTMKENFW